MPQAFAMSITPFDEDYALDEAALRAHLRRMVEAGVGVYLGSPGTGEGHALTADELRRVYEIGVEECKGRVPVYANPPEGRTVEQLRARMEIARAAGVDLVQAYTVDAGHGMRPTEKEQDAYYRELFDGFDYPLGLSVNMLAGGYANPVRLLVGLVRDFPQIEVVNVNNPPISALAELIDELGTRVRFYTDAFMYPDAITLGASGCLTGHVNVVPYLIRALGESLARGDMDTASSAFHDLFRLQRAAAQFGTDPLPQNWSGRWIKATMAALGQPGHSDGRMRRPYATPTHEELTRFSEHLRSQGIDTIERKYR